MDLINNQHSTKDQMINKADQNQNTNPIYKYKSNWNPNFIYFESIFAGLSLFSIISDK